jgi:hypothetical protein
MSTIYIQPYLHKALCILLLALVHQEALAQFTLTGEVRPRGEFRNGYKELKTDAEKPAFFVEQRSRLYVDYVADRYELHVALQDVRIWGAVGQLATNDPSLFNAFEAWGKYNFDDVLSLKIGRQVINFDHERFFGATDWAQTGRSHDAVVLIADDAERNYQLHVGVAFNQQAERLFDSYYFGVNSYKAMQFAWWHKEWEGSTVSLLFQNDGRQVLADSSVAWRQTYGAVAQHALGPLVLDAEVYYQGGENQGGVAVSAWMGSLTATMKTATLPLTIGIDYLSGTRRSSDYDHAFNPLYGTNHKFYGWMDYFYVGNAHGQEQRTTGLIDIYLKTNVKLSARSGLVAHLHQFLSPVDIYKTNVSEGTMNPSLGTELDLVYNLAILPDVKLNVGYSHMWATNTMEAIKRGGNNRLLHNWAWAMIAFKPQLLHTGENDR